MRAVQIVLLLLVLVIGPGRAYAIVNMEGLHFGEAEQGVSTTVALDMKSVAGNTRRSDYGGDLRLQWIREMVQDIFLFSYDWGETAEVVNTDKGFTHYRHIHGLSEVLAVEAYLQAGRNKFARQKYRGLAGGGLRHGFGAGGALRAYFGWGVFFAEEELRPVGVDEKVHSEDWWANTYLLLSWSAKERWSLQNTLYYQPRLAEPADYRVLEQLALRMKTGDNTDLVFTLDFSYDSQPPTAVRKSDRVSGIKFVAKF